MHIGANIPSPRALVSCLARCRHCAPRPVVTFNHNPFYTAVESINGYSGAPPAPSVITVNGKAQFRHSVSNARDVLALVGMSRYAIALAGHMHVREQLRYAGIPLRFYQTAAVVGPVRHIAGVRDRAVERALWIAPAFRPTDFDCGMAFVR